MIVWEQKTEEEAKEIAIRSGIRYRKDRLHTYKYITKGSIQELKEQTPYVRVAELADAPA